MLQVSGITKTFPGVRALDQVDLHVRAGEVHALVGENGAGKSTLVKVLGGAHRPDGGEVLLDRRTLPLGDPVGARRRGVGIIYQELMLVPELTAAENIFLGRERTRRGVLSRGEMANVAGRALADLGCRIDPNMAIRDLGLGARQLVEVARALCADSKLLVFDEPSATLTENELEHLFQTIHQLRDRGLAIIYISHRLEEVFTVADRVTVLRDGRSVATAPIDEVDRVRLIRWMVGRALQEEFPKRQTAIGEVVLEVDGLSCPPYFHDASFTLRRGEVLGVAGLVGAGRTSAALSLFGVLPPVAGSVKLEGRAVRFAGPADALAAGVAYLTEDRKGRGIFEALSVAENITVSDLAAFVRGGLLSESLRMASARQSCRRFDVRAPSLNRPIRTLSGGNQQKALLARLLLKPKKVVILDEPTRGVDVGARAEVYGLINGLVAGGVAVVMISSELPELLGLCDRIVVMREGRAVGTLDRADADQETIMHLATGGTVH